MHMIVTHGFAKKYQLNIKSQFLYTSLLMNINDIKILLFKNSNNVFKAVLFNRFFYDLYST